jgi:hypothetical protein
MVPGIWMPATVRVWIYSCALVKLLWFLEIIIVPPVFIFVLAIKCVDPPVVANSTIETSYTGTLPYESGDNLWFICDVGYAVNPRGGTTRESIITRQFVNCTETGAWEGSTIDCQGNG